MEATNATPYAREAYWRVLQPFVDDEVAVRVGRASASFPISTYPEYRVVNAIAGEEQPVIEALLDRLEPDDVFYDVGANVGTYTCLIGDALPGGEVVAFEPYPPNLASLRRNIEVNGVGATVQEVALSDSEGTVTFSVLNTRKAGSQQGSLVRDVSSDRIDVVSVDAVPGDALVEAGEIPAPTVVKIDVEGAAPAVIRGLWRSLSADHCRVVCVEPHGNTETIRDALSDLGFHVRSIGLSGPRAEESPTLLATTEDA
ncbi:FkbM family methyltransferase [Halomarina halobia]|uniref:FkbM family methyltransferase n=1 Tax=Halomarina halobia TaxID=3033386 RepID=A0ABD6AAQ7_9EURY|nr:FkbM family methyltransferase [Halomarina sp. PSR21]